MSIIHGSLHSLKEYQACTVFQTVELLLSTTMEANKSLIITYYNSSSNCYNCLLFFPLLCTSVFNHLSHFGLIYSKRIYVYIKICWKCACHHQGGLWDYGRHTSLWTSKWGVMKLTFREICMWWWVRCWCYMTRCCPINTCRTNTELFEKAIFDSITKTCNNICLVCDGVEFQC